MRLVWCHAAECCMRCRAVCRERLPNASLEAVAAQEALAVALGYDQALRDLTVSDTLALLRALHHRHQHN
jgi:hypothetical protein